MPKPWDPRKPKYKGDPRQSGDGGKLPPAQGHARAGIDVAVGKLDEVPAQVRRHAGKVVEHLRILCPGNVPQDRQAALVAVALIRRLEGRLGRIQPIWPVT